MLMFNISYFRRLLIRTLKPMSIFIGKLHYAPKHRAVKARDVFDMADVLRAGDVLITFSLGELTNYFIEGDFKHAALYIGNSRVVEAIGKGVSVTDFEEFCAGKDRIAVLRPLFCDESTSRIAALNAISQIGKPYDYYFEMGEQSFYCAELITWAYFNATNGLSPFVKREVMGVETVLPNDFYMAKSKFEIVMERPNT
jgi:uncharacterized protein YycO